MDGPSQEPPSSLHIDPVERLPYEINEQIFKLLNQRELVRSMSTSRKWLTSIPGYTTSVWKRIEFFPGCGWNTCSITMQRVLGPQVKEVSIRHMNDSTVAILNELGIKECKINYLEIQMVQQVSLGDPLINTILLFGRSLRKLCIRDCRMHDATVAHLLQQLPRLTHLTFLTPDMAERHILGPEHLLPGPAEEEGENEEPPDNLFPGLVYLHLDSYRSSIIGVFRIRLLPFLIRCPNLQCLVTSTPHRAHQQNSFYSCMFITRCPKLRYLAWGVPRWLYDTKYPAPNNALPPCTETSIKQRYKAINDEFGNVPLAQNLTGPSLEAFTIYGSYNSLQAIRNQGTDQFLRRFCQNIKVLDVSINNMDLLYLETVNEALYSFADNQLRYLRVNNMISNDHRRYIVCDFPALVRIQHLRYLCFKNVVILQQNLEVISLGLRELNEFHLHFDDPDRLALHPFTEGRLLLFAENLRGNRTLEKLTLTMINTINDHFLNVLMGAEKLFVVRISDTTNTSEEGRRGFLRSRTVDGVLRELELLSYIL